MSNSEIDSYLSRHKHVRFHQHMKKRSYNLNVAHEASRYNRKALENSAKCGCYHCLKIFLHLKSLNGVRNQTMMKK